MGLRRHISGQIPNGRAGLIPNVLGIGYFGLFWGLSAVEGQVDGLYGRTVRFHNDLDPDPRHTKVGF